MYFSVSRYPYYTVIFCDMINVRGCPRVPVRISTGERRPLGVSATRRGNNAHKRDKGPLSATLKPIDNLFCRVRPLFRFVHLSESAA